MSTPQSLPGHSSANPQKEQNPTKVFDLSQLTSIISEIVTEQNNKLNNLNNDNNIDQTIDDQYRGNLTDLDKIPDVVKCLREFSGLQGEFSSWKKSVDRILHVYEHLQGTPKYYGILSVIRNKIVGHADVALESYNTPLNWHKIAKCLTLHYADKRDLGTLEYQMMTLVQGNQTIPEFYQSVYQHLSLILNKLSCTDMGQESLNNLTESYRYKALDTFIRGLKGDLPRLLSIREPSDLPQALHLCLKLQNIDYRIQHANSNSQNGHRRPPIPPPPILRKNTQPFYPQLLHNPQNYSHPKPIPSFNRSPFGFPAQQFRQPQYGFQNWQYPTTPRQYHNPQRHPFLPPKPQQPMEVDHHAEQQNEDPEVALYQDQMNEYDAEYNQTLIEYTDSINNPSLIEEIENQNEDNEQVEQLDDIHFLD